MCRKLLRIGFVVRPVFGQHVNHRAEAGSSRTHWLTLSLARQEPIPRAGENTGQLAAGKMDRLLRAEQELIGPAQRTHPPPVLWSRGRDEWAAVVIGCIGQPCQSYGGLLTEPRRDFRVDGGAAELTDQGRQRQGLSRPSRQLPHGHAKLSEEAGRLVGLSLSTRHRCHNEPRSSPGACDVEEPSLLRYPSRGRNGCQHLVAPQLIRF